MHEYSIAQRVLRILEDVSEDHDGAPVAAATVAVGPLTRVVPELLYEAWDNLTDGTAMEGTELDIEHVPIVAVCEECGHETESTTPFVRCEECDSMNLKLKSGHELQVISAEIDAEKRDINES